MKNYLLLLFSFGFLGVVQAQPLSAQTKYDIIATIDSSFHLEGIVDITYTNKTDYSLDTLQLHLWLNAFSTKKSEYCTQSLSNGDRNFYFADEDDMGRLIVTAYSDEIKQLNYIQNNEILKLVLDRELKPQDQIKFRLEYSAKFPKQNSRTGRFPQGLSMVHWYPKVAVVEEKKWKTMPYLGFGEYYSEFASYNVQIYHPESWHIVVPFVTNATPTSKSIEADNVGDITAMIYNNAVTMESRTTTSGININTISYQDESIWSLAADMATEIIEFFEDSVGPFPYQNVIIAQGNLELKSAMEYPGMVTINDVGDHKELEYYIAHELAHQYFYGATGFNERDEPHMDEGLATFYENKYMTNKYGSSYYNSTFPKMLSVPDEPLVFMHLNRHLCKTNQCISIDQASITKSGIQYALNSYPRSAEVFDILSDYLDENLFSKTMRQYYADRKFKHSGETDFINYFESKTGKDLNWMRLIFQGNPVSIDLNRNEGFIMISHSAAHPILIPAVVDLGDEIVDTLLMVPANSALRVETNGVEIDPYRLYTHKATSQLVMTKPLSNIKIRPFPSLDLPLQKEVFVSPILGYNSSDGLMIGALLSNQTFPSKRFRWAALPFYGFGSRNLVGFANLSYQILKDTSPSYWQIGYDLKSFHLEHNEKFDYHLRYTKNSLNIAYHDLKNEFELYYKYRVGIDHLSENRAFFASADDYDIKPLKFNHLSIDVSRSHKGLISNNSQTISIKSIPHYGDGEYFIRADGEWNNSWYYEPTKSIDVRLWGSYFLANTKRSVQSFNTFTTRGSTGLVYSAQNDYSYDDMWLSRQNASNQIYLKNGGFKVFPAEGVNLAQSNDLAFAANFIVDLPFKPRWLPFQVFFDAGGYSTYSIEGNRTINYLYNGGIAVSLFNNSIQLFVPIVQSDNINLANGNRSFFSNVSWYIDIHKLNLWERQDRFMYEVKN